MQSTKHNRLYLSLVFILYLVSAIASIEWINRGQRDFLRTELLSRAKEELSIVRSQLETTIVSDIYAAKSLSALVTVNPDVEISHWKALAKNILQEGKHLRIIGLAPDDVIRMVYPEEGNERAVGVDYRTIPQQWSSVKKAREIQKVFISGPVDLVQGGRGIIARIPIFTDPPFNTDYWGCSSVIIDVDSLFHQVGIESFSYKYDLAIKGMDSAGMDGDLVHGSNAVFDNAFDVQTVFFPYGSWVLAGAIKDNILTQVPWYRVYIARLIGYPIMLLLTLSFFVIYRQYISAYKRSLHDDLTSLPNRRYFMFTLRNLFNDCSQRGCDEAFAVLSIDLDKFKTINDTYGHAAGDKVLAVCAERLKSVLRSTDLVARVGGDEFLVILSRISNSSDVDVVNIELQKALCQTPVIYEENLIDIRASIGYVLYLHDYPDIEALLKVADERMYQQKGNQ
ncbi:diguanylate cyclase [uncultured Vibrio sp.]|uniref:diguanylate cyclase n=1 Tax=uncultured Vibrio sp. TaxID=114054 RepID=UPI0025DE1606|nr:diguanylate cyclase [uncultured Vibrio sp.]